MSAYLQNLNIQKPQLNERMQTLKLDGGLTYPVVQLSGSVASQSLTAAQSGSLVFIAQPTVAITISLPSPAAGLSYQFIVQSVGDGSHSATVAATSNICDGSLFNNAGGSATVTSEQAKTNAILGDSASTTIPGDSIIYWCDGSRWIFRAFSAATGWTFN